MIGKIIALSLLYFLIGIISVGIVGSITDWDYDDKKLTAVLLFWPLFLVFFILKLIFKLFKLFFETIRDLFFFLFE